MGSHLNVQLSQGLLEVNVDPLLPHIFALHMGIICAFSLQMCLCLSS